MSKKKETVQNQENALPKRKLRWADIYRYRWLYLMFLPTFLSLLIFN
ncbi:MAG: hypothetical protein LUG61_07590 [Lachnospiraceae bacterium]|nr:hypothetical protein [Lachnospiraceae bacterium]